MIDNTLVDVLTGTGSFGLSAIFSSIHKLLKVRSHEKEADKIRAHEVTMSAMGHSLEDLKDARSIVSEKDKTTLSGSFIGWTRRIIALCVISLIMGVIFSRSGVSVPFIAHHSFLWISWTTHKVQELPHLAWLPCFPQLLFMVVGFYFGRLPSK